MIPKRTILISGASGFIGSALCPHLENLDYAVVRLVRRPVKNELTEIEWNPSTGELDLSKAPEIYGAINLSGENIASGRWTKKKRNRLIESRTRTTSLLATKLALLKSPPKVFISGSAVGYYGDRPSEILTENSSVGTGFLATLGAKWEQAAAPAEEAGIRVVHPRIGVVLGKAGGALAKMLLPFKLGLGGKLGPGTQMMSWIALTDIITAFEYLLRNEALRGPVNFVAPNAVNNTEFTKALGQVLNRPTPFPVPSFALRLLFGEMADEALLASTHAIPQKLIEAGFSFHSPELKGALETELQD